MGLEPLVQGPGVEEGGGTRWGWVRSPRVYNVRLRSDPIGRRQEWKSQVDVTCATREPSDAEVRLGPGEEHHRPGHFGGGDPDQEDSEAMRRQDWERRRGWSGLRAGHLGAEGLVSDGRRWVTGLGRPPV